MKLASTLITILAAAPVSGFISISKPSPVVVLKAVVESPNVEVLKTALLDIDNPSAAAAVPKDADLKIESEATTVKKIEVEEVDKTLDPAFRVQTGRYDGKENSIAIPFLKRPSKLDGTHAGDIGFDPLGFSETQDMYMMMEAEIRHARLAMLAVIGWPLSELLAPQWLLHGKAHLAPSVLNGFDPLTFIGVAAIFGGFGYFEYKTSLRRTNDKALGKKHAEDMANVWEYGVPGDYNFDPLNLYSAFGDSADGRKGMRELEIAHGRSAMLGITAFAIWEALTGHPIVENSMFFHPNLLLPVIGAAYLAFGFFYEIKNDDQYLFQIEETSEGSVRIEGINNRLKRLADDGVKYFGIASVKTAEYTKIAAVTSKKIGQTIDDVTDSYTKYSMSKNYDNE